ncbi:uncharacterized protein LOC141827178 [Curcuma longa]|uniref:uncharacterized protein LOC141827178 n=1 Tax=Curcuma longa TaxID=136217 RepID=UPI003D9DF006
MEYHLKMQVDMWIVIQTGFILPTDADGIPQPYEKWNVGTKCKIEANAKVTQTLQCGLTNEELNRVGPFISVKDLWGKLIELHEKTLDTKDRESVSGLHARIQDLLNGLHAIG